MGRASRDKGARAERAACVALGEHLGGVWARTAMQASGVPGIPDVHSPRYNGVHVEVKNNQSLSAWAALQQATRDAKSRVPVVVMKRDRKPWLVVVELERLRDLVDEINEEDL